MAQVLSPSALSPSPSSHVSALALSVAMDLVDREASLLHRIVNSSISSHLSSLDSAIASLRKGVVCDVEREMSLSSNRVKREMDTLRCVLMELGEREGEGGESRERREREEEVGEGEGERDVVEGMGKVSGRLEGIEFLLASKYLSEHFEEKIQTDTFSLQVDEKRERRIRRERNLS